ncbi:unnamed protein product [marine sediment metagenome]|uniref:ABC transmembrane type-1 domain-containing protein n=1 Tax=marine sediment metagenome TaxID=412755 RepID=X1RXU7_9ZZZZ
MSLNNFWRQFKQYKPAYIGAIILLLAIIAGLFPQYIAPNDPWAMKFELFAPPFASSLLGTDQLGRDVLSRSIYGLRTSLLVGIGAAGIATMLGVVLGAIPGYFGGKVDYIFSRFFEIFMMIPTFFLVVLVVAIFGPNIKFIMLIIGLTSWPATARIMRSQVMTLKTREFVESSLVIGGGDIYTIYCS